MNNIYLMGNEAVYTDSSVEGWIIDAIDKGKSPKRLLRYLFKTIDDKLKSDNLNEYKAVLYCHRFGFFCYSDEFKDFVRLHYNIRLTNNDRETYHYVEAYAQLLNIPIGEALNRTILYNDGFVSIKYVPKHRAYKIVCYDSAEFVEILDDFCN